MQPAETRFNIAVDARSNVNLHLRQWRNTLLWQRLILTMAAVSVLVLVTAVLAAPAKIRLLAAFMLALVSFAHLFTSRGWRQLTVENFLQHLNRRFEDFEESAQLLVSDVSALTPLAGLQRQRVLAVYQKNIEQASRWRPVIRYKPAMIVILLCLVSVNFSDQIRLLPQRFESQQQSSTPTGTGRGPVTVIDDISVLIRPPAYSGLAPVESEQLDLELLEGSRVQWKLSFDTNGQRYALLLSDERRLELEMLDDGYLTASAVISKTGLYRIISNDSPDDEGIGDIYALQVTLDQPPDIRIMEPVVSSLEIAKTATPRFNSQALLRDDFGIETVEILASVAKGSGEAVKFRDQTLGFDHSSETEKGMLFERSWDLTALGMEPGDELYFTVVATDNKQPQANTGRSGTVIVRWLDDDRSGLAADGLSIDFIPEFFKSQRQIIIDTEQLINDESRLPTQTFREVSRDIGQSQADLKQKYGQYLGDEFGEGPAGQAAMISEIAESASSDDHPEDGHGEADEHEHANKQLDNISNMSELLRLFGHDHGDPEIGPITRQNPVALMKRAVSEMWQAERHLLQAQPAEALPFEYEAYKYLKLARQADRIYVKRLGFEPPPVSEDRRLTGELDGIRSYQTRESGHQLDPAGEQWQQRLLSDVYHLLSSNPPTHELTETERGLLTQLGRLLADWSQLNPALIEHAASTEKLLLSGTLSLDDCNNCIQELGASIWRLLNEPGSQATARRASWLPADELIRDYREALESGT